eukprot:2168391-Prymnesium_polylepis.1
MEQQEANDAAGEVDLLLNDLLDELGFEAEDMSFADELKTMAIFSTDGEDDAAQTATPAAKRSLLRDAAALSLFSLIPPDR